MQFAGLEDRKVLLVAQQLAESINIRSRFAICGHIHFYMVVVIGIRGLPFDSEFTHMIMVSIPDKLVLVVREVIVIAADHNPLRIEWLDELDKIGHVDVIGVVFCLKLFEIHNPSLFRETHFK